MTNAHNRVVVDSFIGPTPSLLNVIIDTNPYAWASLAKTLTVSQAVANLLVFINAHLAFNYANQVAVIASHTEHAEFLYPQRLESPIANGRRNGTSSDLEMSETPTTNGASSTNVDDANFYRPFALISSVLRDSLVYLFEQTTATSLQSNYTTHLAGALTLALTHINRQTLALSTDNSTSNNNSSTLATNPKSPLSARILILSASSASPAQYISFMNTIFAAQRLSIPIDVLSLVPAVTSSFLQQACDATGGIYLPLTHPHGMLQTLMLGFLASPPSRALLVSPTQISVDFRAACFCHRRVVDVGFVCSICLSIFCEPPQDSVCLTCGTLLRAPSRGKPAVVVRKKKKKRKENGEAGTPQPG